MYTINTDTIQIIENYSVIRNTLKFVFNNDNHFCVTNSFSNINDYFNQTNKNSPDILIVGLNTACLAGNDIFQRLKQYSPKTQIAVLITSEEENDMILSKEIDFRFSLRDNFLDIVEKLKN